MTTTATNTTKLYLGGKYNHDNALCVGQKIEMFFLNIVD